MTIPLWFMVSLFPFALLAGAAAALVGFGIGSLLTPLMVVYSGVDSAIAMVALPHLAAGLFRGWRLRRSIDRAVLLRFGLVSAVGGMFGAFVFAHLAPAALRPILGGLLVLTASAGLAGGLGRWNPPVPLVWVLGAVSGFFGGVVGNQGGVRAAALSAFDLRPAAFVATSTAVGVMIDLARIPIYLNRVGSILADAWIPIALAVLGVLAGTLLGERLLLGLSRRRFRQMVSAAVGLVGMWFLLRSF